MRPFVALIAISALMWVGCAKPEPADGANLVAPKNANAKGGGPAPGGAPTSSLNPNSGINPDEWVGSKMKGE